jgi:1-acyl-sn-glycerol-3-phosphate acyltransferase
VDQATAGERDARSSSAFPAGTGVNDVAVDACLERVLTILRPLVDEVSGARALGVLSPGASLERELGLGSLERAQLMVRLAATFEREIGHRFLSFDSAIEIASALAADARGCVSRGREPSSPTPPQPPPNSGGPMAAGPTAAPDSGWSVPRALYVTRLVLMFPFYLAFFLVTWGIVAAVPHRGLAFALGRIGARFTAWVARWRLAVEGGENLPVDGPVILVSNHSSFADVPALMALFPRNFLFVAKKEVASWRFTSTFVRRLGHPIVDRWNPERSISDLHRIADVIRRGDAVLFFSEGTFARSPGLRPFRLGAFELAAMTGAPVVPLALRGSRSALWFRRRIPYPGAIKLWIGAPIHAEGTTWRDVIELRNRVAESIAEHCGEPRLDVVAAGPPASQRRDVSRASPR